VWDNVVGEPLPDVRLHVDEATGELWVGGPQVTTCVVVTIRMLQIPDACVCVYGETRHRSAHRRV